MKQFHSLRVVGKQFETRDSVRISLDVAPELRSEFVFSAGQHLPIQIEVAGKKLRRTYSICSAPDVWPLQIGVRIQAGGNFSEFVAQQLEVGDDLEVLPPTGRFVARPNNIHAKHYLGFAAGSGITPVLSIIKSLLQAEPSSRFTLFYGNREQATTMFIDDLYDLKNMFLDRLQLHFLFSREEQEFGIASGRIDSAKVQELLRHFSMQGDADEAFVCGPDSMIAAVTEALLEAGFDQSTIHAERFGAPRKTGKAAGVTGIDKQDSTRVTVIMDGHRKSFDMPQGGANVVDAALAQNIELPYSCKGGVCATCRTFVRSGSVEMATNYGLEPWEVEEGFVLACQSSPQSEELVLDYDKA